MSDKAHTPSLWTLDGFKENAYTRVETLEDGAASARMLVTLETFLSFEDAQREMIISRIGVELQPGEAVDALLPYLARLPMIALAFPAYTDGRSYSKAQLLRERHGYKGELRATGDVLLDQVAHMLRVGFTVLEVSHQPTIERLARGDLGGIAHAYQPAARTAPASGGYSWRRLAG
ncbi:DUF934 domain-containing protein [Nitratireductor basaltis]|uniref:Oxidoreductase probably involved in sulfite reduction n=1 Tax=Nitratireductor basaltis TaxID=472175 RepID=A0A084U617_9HYPH|nr:DUF934 domain-containing protein [Nitratireductor basaltis]KFB08403.1 hypothetical protein EL18_02653 [Nitratireductor basaltis]